MELRIKILQKDQNCHMNLPCSLKILTKLKFQISKFNFLLFTFYVYDAQALTDRTERAKLRCEKVESKFEAKTLTTIFKIFEFPIGPNSLMIYEFIPLLLPFFQNSKKSFRYDLKELNSQ